MALTATELSQILKAARLADLGTEHSGGLPVVAEGFDARLALTRLMLDGFALGAAQEVRLHARIEVRIS